MSIQEAAERQLSLGRRLKDEYPPETSNSGRVIAFYNLLQLHLSSLYEYIDAIETSKLDGSYRSKWLTRLVSAYIYIDRIVSVIVNNQQSSSKKKSQAARQLFDTYSMLRLETTIVSHEMSNSVLEGILSPRDHLNIADSLMFIGDYEGASSIILDYFLSLYNASKPELSVIENDIASLSKLISPEPQLFSLHKKRKDEGYVSKPKKSAEHPGSLIASELEAAKLSVSEAASKLGMTRTQLHRIIRGDSDISEQTALQLAANNFGPSARDWLILQIDFNLAKHESGNSPRIGRPPAKQARSGTILRRQL